MRHNLTFVGLAALLAANVSADTVKIDSFGLHGPFAVKTPAMVDSLNVKKEAFSAKDLLFKEKLPVLSPAKAKKTDGRNLPSAAGDPAIGYLTFDVTNPRYAKADLKVEGLDEYAVYLDGNKLEGTELSLSPATHQLVIKYLALPGAPVSPTVSLEGDGIQDLLTVGNGGKRMFTLDEVMDGLFLDGARISPDGRYALVNRHSVLHGGETSYEASVMDVASGRMTPAPEGAMGWTPDGNSLMCVRKGKTGTELILADPASGKETLVATNLPSSDVRMTPDGKKLIITEIQEGPKEEHGAYQVLEPEDRQPGWRDRRTLSLYDLETGIVTPLTYGHRNVSLEDISPDSKKALVNIEEMRYTQRPTKLFSIYEIDLDTHEMRPLVEKDGFIGQAMYSPDGKQVLLTGGPESLGGIGKNVPKGRIPSMVDMQLFIMDLADGSVKAMTKNFNPSVSRVDGAGWNKADGLIYFTAEDKDLVSLFRLNPETGEIVKVDLPEEYIGGISLASQSPVAVFTGEGVGNPSRLYALDLKSLQPRLLDAPRDPQFDDVAIGECLPWEFKNSQGDVINCRYYLPPNFDPNKKYPLIVNYYGGCSPTSRQFATRYPQSVYASHGYVMLVINPSGATGFGQEFSSRHVNTAGKRVAEDIIEGTKKFCKEHAYVNDKKIGCIGASYGGFMTQYLQTVTDLFAAAVSHAGISDHTSYWGNGYWGYSYSEVSMADSYPWSDQELYVKQSPLYNAQKVNTPLLFVHGASDNNVPVGESRQMFTALKLLGKDTALVEVEGEDHWILGYDNRHRWQDTIFAWFAKYLQDDPAWWENLYPDKAL